MTVSVAIPTYFGEATIFDTVMSVVRQDIEDLEVIISDDASRDATVDVVRRIDDSRIRVLESSIRLGPEGNWNRALDACKGTYVKVLAQDDLLYESNLRTAVDLLDANPLAALASVKRDIVGSDGSVLLRDRGLKGLSGVVDSSDAVRAVVRAGSNLFGEGASVLLRREAARASGGFDGTLPYVIDVDYWIRLLRWGSLIAVPRTLAAFRVSDGSWSKSLVREQGQQFAALIDKLEAGYDWALDPVDVRVGKARSQLNGFLRQAFYIRHRRHM